MRLIINLKKIMLGVDYQLCFYKTNECNLADQYLDINNTINNCLLVDANSNKFKNFLFVKIEELVMKVIHIKY